AAGAPPPWPASSCPDLRPAVARARTCSWDFELVNQTDAYLTQGRRRWAAGRDRDTPRFLSRSLLPTMLAAIRLRRTEVSSKGPCDRILRQLRDHVRRLQMKVLVTRTKRVQYASARAGRTANP